MPIVGRVAGVNAVGETFRRFNFLAGRQVLSPGAAASSSPRAWSSTLKPLKASSQVTGHKASIPIQR